METLPNDGIENCVCSFLEVVEEDADNSIVEAALEVGNVPHIKEGMCEKDGGKVSEETRRLRQKQMIFCEMVCC